VVKQEQQGFVNLVTFTADEESRTDVPLIIKNLP
jgi:hypothetical protein